MKKNIILILVFNCFSIFTFGQIKNNDSGLVLYNATLYMRDSLVSGVILEQSLVFENKEVSYFHNKHLESLNEPLTVTIVNGGKPYISYYQNLDTKILVYRGRTPKTRYLIKDTMTIIPWKLSKKSKKIQNIECFSAQAEYRGRVWTAWYAPSIPVSSGPWKLYGLPGLILEAEDIRGFVKFECVSIVIPKPQSDSFIEIPKVQSNENSITTKEYEVKCEKDIINAEKMSVEITKDTKTKMLYSVSDIDIFEFEKKLTMKRKQQKLSDTPKK